MFLFLVHTHYCMRCVLFPTELKWKEMNFKTLAARIPMLPHEKSFTELLLPLIGTRICCVKVALFPLYVVMVTVEFVRSLISVYCSYVYKTRMYIFMQQDTIFCYSESVLMKDLCLLLFIRSLYGLLVSSITSLWCRLHCSKLPALISTLTKFLTNLIVTLISTPF